MDITYKFADGLFYPSDIEYKTLPDGAIDVPAEEFIKAMRRPRGYDFSVDANGMVTLFEQATSEEELRLQAESQRTLLKQSADSEIGWRQYAIDSGKATAEEVDDLVKWQDYRLDLMRVNILKPEWPQKP
ncbi:tail fiber assembly protein [Kluyvera sp. Awk 3]|uniref:tail fiber assembly protein n=1 Tax=Kluyvera sp. Awk 3 TaxID=2963956 RepID=UPI00230301D0|nr:tail fiber assembly protein [Kluyvera sp. Awk 3]MDA8487494.1 tail fiber assembly protein [Kluyvera sp. Awk 3]